MKMFEDPDEYFGEYVEEDVEEDAGEDVEEDGDEDVDEDVNTNEKFEDVDEAVEEDSGEGANENVEMLEHTICLRRNVRMEKRYDDERQGINLSLCEELNCVRRCGCG